MSLSFPFVSLAGRDIHEDFPSNYYEWTSLYKLFVRKHGGIRQMQTYVLKRCLRNRQALEEHFQLSLHSSRQQKWYQFLEDRDAGNRKALKALTEHMPRVTHSYMLHQVHGKFKSDLRVCVQPKVPTINILRKILDFISLHINVLALPRK